MHRRVLTTTDVSKAIKDLRDKPKPDLGGLSDQQQDHQAVKERTLSTLDKNPDKEFRIKGKRKLNNLQNW